MRSGVGVICDPAVLDRLGLTDEEDEMDDAPPLPAKMSGPDTWPLPIEEGDEHTMLDFETYMRSTRRRNVGSVVNLTKLRG